MGRASERICLSLKEHPSYLWCILILLTFWVKFFHIDVVQVHHLCRRRVSGVQAEGRKWPRKWGQRCSMALEGMFEWQEGRGDGDKATGRDCFENPASTLTCLACMEKGEIQVSEWHYPTESDHSSIIKESSGFTHAVLRRCSCKILIWFGEMFWIFGNVYLLCNFSVFKKPSCLVFPLNYSSYSYICLFCIIGYCSREWQENDQRFPPFNTSSARNHNFPSTH